MPTTDELQVCVDRLAYSDQAGTIPVLAAQVKATTQNRTFYVDTLAELPNPQTTFITEGILYYVDEIKNYVIYTGVSWEGIDGRKLDKLGARVYAWGISSSGQLGTGSNINQLIVDTEVTCDNKWCDISAGCAHTAAVKSDGSLWSWGANITGSLGVNNSVATYNSPVREASSANNWCQVSASTNYTVALKRDNSLWGWGSNVSGQLGDGTAIDRSSPVREATFGNSWCAVSAGDLGASAIKVDGSLWSWGGNGNGRLGDNTIVSKSSPVREVSLSNNWCKVSSSGRMTAAIKTDGSLWTWGLNDCGQLGDNTIISKSSPVRETTSSTSWCDVCVVNYFSSALRKDGTLWAWGTGACYALGNNGVLSVSTPTQDFTRSTEWCKVSIGGGAATGVGSYGMAIKKDGTLWAWGNNNCFQIGCASLVNYSVPCRIGCSSRWADVSTSNSGLHSVGLNGFPVC